MNLSEILEKQYILQQTRINNEKTIAHYRRSVRRLGEMLGRAPLISDLTDETISGLMRWEQVTRGVSAETANHARKCLVALWRWCRDKELVRGGPTVAKLQVPKRLPRAWSAEEWTRLVRAVELQTGTIGAVCIKHGRQYVGLELNPAYVELAKERIGQAVRESATPLFEKRPTYVTKPLFGEN